MSTAKVITAIRNPATGSREYRVVTATRSARVFRTAPSGKPGCWELRVSNDEGSDMFLAQHTDFGIIFDAAIRWVDLTEIDE